MPGDAVRQGNTNLKGWGLHGSETGGERTETMTRRCLIVADDLTGGADTGVRFSKQGLNTFFLHSGRLNALDLSLYAHNHVLIVNTESRGMSPEQAFSAVASVLKTYDGTLFPIIYKKIDSTLRGNIGQEIDAILHETDLPMAFVAPSLPEQNRAVAGGIMMIAGRPVALTEMAQDAVSPARESNVCTLIRGQSRHGVALIDLTCVSSGPGAIRKAVLEEQKKGARIVVFDATRSDDLAHIAEVALGLDRPPLLVGSAGLAGEVAKRICPSTKETSSSDSGPVVSRFRTFFIISGSASEVTRKQLEKLETNRRINSFVVNPSHLVNNKSKGEYYGKEFYHQIAEALGQGHAILKVSPVRISPGPHAGPLIHVEIIRALGSIARAVLREVAQTRGVDELAVVLTGGETAAGVLDFLEVEGIRIEGEPASGIVMSRVQGKNLAGLAIITKAGAFGGEDAMEDIVEMTAGGRRPDSEDREESGALFSPPVIGESPSPIIEGKSSAVKPLIAITMGDATGAGPEIIVKSLEDKSLYNKARLFVLGDSKIMSRAAGIVGSAKPIRTIDRPDGAGDSPDSIDVLDLDNLPEDLPFAVIDGRAGKAAYEYVKTAVELAMVGKIDGIVTAPLNKEALNQGGYHFAGHTEILAHLSGTRSYAMMLVGGHLRVIHVTTHVSMRQACDLIRKERVLQVIELGVLACRLLGFPQPRVAVAGLNPHAGEGGLFGREEIEEIIPAVELARGKGYDVSGPIPPDTVFYRAAVKRHFDIVVCMYHDQGHIPLKVFSFETGVNVTVGLPFIRTSVDHGTVFGKAGKGTADNRSMDAAIALAVRMAERKVD